MSEIAEKVVNIEISVVVACAGVLKEKQKGSLRVSRRYNIMCGARGEG